MIEDDIIREIRATRDAFAQSHNYDVWAMMAALREAGDRDDLPIVRLAPRRPVEDDEAASREVEARSLAEVAARRYLKVVEWSEEDGVYVGRCFGIIGPCCHGDDEIEVYRKLRGIVEDWVGLAIRDGRPLPAPTAGTGLARKLV